MLAEQRLTLCTQTSILKNNPATPSCETMNARLISRCETYGNALADGDQVSAELLRYYCQAVEKYQNPRCGQFTPGSYTVSAHVPLGAGVGATRAGRCAGRRPAHGRPFPAQREELQVESDGPVPLTSTANR
ncbi:pyruvate formate lyase family protein, partial [Salmonella enterica]|uniref:pyruvate formate lyase family protein n=1 Tax=Salmonella enterica TaxID=28901 RepID=UPI00398C4551